MCLATGFCFFLLLSDTFRSQEIKSICRVITTCPCFLYLDRVSTLNILLLSKLPCKIPFAVSFDKFKKTSWDPFWVNFCVQWQIPVYFHVFCMWLSNFPSTIYQRGFLLPIVCFWLLCQKLLVVEVEFFGYHEENNFLRPLWYDVVSMESFMMM